MTGRVLVNTTGSDFDTLLAVYHGGSVSNLALVAANDDDPFALDTATSRLWFEAGTGTNYSIVVDGWNGAFGQVQLHLTEPPRPPNDSFAQRQPLSGLTAHAGGNNVDATRESGEPLHAGSLSARSIWWRWVAPAPGIVTLTTAGSDFDTLLAVYRGSEVAQLSPIVVNDQDPLGGNTSRVTFETCADLEYSIAVDGVANDAGLVVLSLQLLPSPRLTVALGSPPGPALLALVGVAGQRYVIESTETPAHGEWSPLLTNASLPASVWEFVDPQPPASTNRYYRAVLIP